MICKNCLKHKCICIGNDSGNSNYSSVASISTDLNSVSPDSSTHNTCNIYIDHTHNPDTHNPDTHNPDTHNPDQIIICNNCNVNFKNKQTLNLHLKTIDCTNLNDVAEIIDKTVCEYCKKKFSSKQMKNYHHNNCIEKIKYEITATHREEIEKIRKEYEDLIANYKPKFQ